MGCAQSRIENEEAVARCKERRSFMADAVAARNAFAAAHFSYTMSLKNTGAALSDFGQGESHPHRSSAAPSPASASTSAAAAASSSAAAIQPPIDNLPPPPPPLPDFSPAPLHRSASMPLHLPKKFHHPNPDPDDTILEEDDDDEHDHDHDDTHRHSTSTSATAAPETPISAPRPPPPPRPQPSPPPPPMPESKGMDTWDDYFFSMDENMAGSSLPRSDEIRPENAEVPKFKSPSAATPPPEAADEPPATPEKMVLEPLPKPKPVKKPKPSVVAHHQHSESMGALEIRRGKMVAATPPSIDFLQVLTELDDHFLKASESAHEVSKMLEANRMHYHSNFADNRGHIDHSARVMRVITWNKSFKGIPNGNDVKDDFFDNDEWETHATVLDKMLAWEKKLYKEVKAGELMKIEYQRKVALLNKQKKRGANPEAIEKIKAVVSHLHTRYIVDMQSMDSTVSEIQRLRDHLLFPKLVELVDGMAIMWGTMYVHHDYQLKITLDLRGLDISNALKEISEHHYDRTVQLYEIVKEWHAQFQKLVSHQKEYIHLLNSWLKLSLIPIESSLKEKVSSPPRPHQPPIQALLHAWHDHLEKLPDDLAKSAILSFSAVLNTIMTLQQDELKQKEKCDEIRKEYMRKSRAFEDWYHKHSQKRAGASHDAEPQSAEGANTDDQVTERRFVVETLKTRVDEEEEAHKKLCKQVREKSLGSLKTHLPELFRAMSDFALSCSEMYKDLRFISQPHNQGAN